MIVFLKCLKRRSVLLFAVFSVFLPAISAAQTLDPATSKDTANILKKVEFLQDPTGRLSFRDLLRPAAEKAFKPFRSTTFASANEEATYWFRFDVAAGRNAPLDATIYFSDPNVTRMHVVRQVVGANADVFRYDPRNNVDNTVTTQFGVGLPVSVQPGQRRSIYVSIRGPKLSGQLELWDRSALDKHLSIRAGLRIVLLALVGVSVLIAGAAIVRRQRIGWLFLPFAAVVYALYHWIGSTAFFTPQFLGTLDLPLFLVALFAASITLFCAGLLRREVIAQHILWWSVLLGCAMIASTLMGLFLPGPAKLFSYVLIAALCAVCLFISVSLLTFKNAHVFQLKAIFSALCAASIALMPRWSLDLAFLGDLPSFLIVGTLFFGALLCFVTPADAKLLGVNETSVTTDIDIFAVENDVSEPASRTAEKFEVEHSVAAALPQDAHSRPEDDRGEDEKAPLEAPSEPPQAPAAAADDQYGAILAKAQSAKAMAAVPMVPAATVIEEDGLPTAIDTLTGVYTDATIQAIGQKTLAQAKRYERNHTAIMLRMVDYTKMQETLGQPTSDRAAKLMAVTSMRELRESDALGRLEDDTFIAILPETDFNGAVAGLARTKSNIIERTLPTRAGMKRLDIVFSATSMRDTDERFDQVIERLQQGLTDDVSLLREEPDEPKAEAAE